MPRERLVYERHKSRPVHVSVSGRNRAVPQPYTINLIHVHCGRRTERGRRKYSSRSVARGGFFIPFHGTIPLLLSKRNFKSPGWKNLFGQTVHSDYFPIIFPRPPANSSSFAIFNRPIVGINFHMLKFFILPLLWGTFFSFQTDLGERISCFG